MNQREAAPHVRRAAKLHDKRREGEITATNRRGTGLQARPIWVATIYRRFRIFENVSAVNRVECEINVSSGAAEKL